MHKNEEIITSFLDIVLSTVPVYLTKEQEREDYHLAHERLQRVFLSQRNLPSVTYSRRMLRLQKGDFEGLLKYVEPQLIQRAIQTCRAYPPELTLSATLRYLMTGESLLKLSRSTQLPVPFLMEIIPYNCDLLYKTLSKDYLAIPETNAAWAKISEDFEEIWQFPLCLGAIDLRRYLFTGPPKYTPSPYIIEVQALCDAHHRFTFVDIESTASPERKELIGNFFGRVLDDVQRSLPRAQRIGNNRTLPHVFIGDEMFEPVVELLMTPFERNTRNPQEKAFNFRRDRAMQTIDHAFQLLSGRFRVLQSAIELPPAKVLHVVQACIVLHNFFMRPKPAVKAATPPRLFDLVTQPEYTQRKNEAVQIVRNELAAYFAEEGRLEIQDDFICLHMAEYTYQDAKRMRYNEDSS